MKKVCAIFERRPRTQRSIRDSRAAKLIDKVEFDGDSGRQFELARVLKVEIADRGYRLTGAPYPTTHAEFDWVAYVHTQGLGSPATTKERKKPVRVGAGQISRRLPLPIRGQRVKKAQPAVAAATGERKKRVAVTIPKNERTIPPRKRPTKLPSKRRGVPVQKAE